MRGSTLTRILLATALVVGLLALAGPAGAEPFSVKAGEYGVLRLGPFKTKTTRTYHAKVGDAIRAFGQPSNLFPNGSGGCVGKWRRFGLRIEFYDFGGDTRSICHPEVGQAQSFTIRGSRKWRTHAGLRIGMRESQVQEKHIWAEWHDTSRFHEQGYWLVTAVSPFGDGGEYPALAAHLRHGHYGRSGASPAGSARPASETPAARDQRVSRSSAPELMQ